MVKASAYNVGDLGSIPGSGRAPGEGHGNPLQYSCLENSMDGGAWRATDHGVAKSRMQLSGFHFHSVWDRSTASLKRSMHAIEPWQLGRDCPVPGMSCPRDEGLPL